METRKVKSKNSKLSNIHRKKKLKRICQRKKKLIDIQKMFQLKFLGPIWDRNGTEGRVARISLAALHVRLETKEENYY